MPRVCDEWASLKPFVVPAFTLKPSLGSAFCPPQHRHSVSLSTCIDREGVSSNPEDSVAHISSNPAASGASNLSNTSGSDIDVSSNVVLSATCMPSSVPRSDSVKSDTTASGLSQVETTSNKPELEQQ